jgi:hypothetical protein
VPSLCQPLSQRLPHVSVPHDKHSHAAMLDDAA